MGVGLIIAGAVPVLAYGLYCIYMKTVKSRCHCQKDLTGKTVIVTGADKNIGFYTALDMAQRNARVILACRNVEMAHAAAADIQAKTGNRNVIVHHLDVSLLQSVHQFAKEIHEQEDRLDILINNAGTAAIDKKKRTLTDEGLEVTFATNYIGPFLLTHLLLDKLKQCSPSRVVNVSSIGHKFAGPLDLKNLNSDKSYVPSILYAQSKLALNLFTRELARRLDGTGVTVNSVHPGSVNTDLLNCIPWPWNRVGRLMSVLFFRSAEEGAQTSIHVSVSHKVSGVSGEYFSECRPASQSKHALDDGVARKLYELTEQLASLQ